MAENVVGFPKQKKKPRVSYKGFVHAFRRLQVERQLERVKADDLALLPRVGSPPMEWYTARYDGPGEKYREASLHVLTELGIAPELLLYRVLRDLFGPPDNITVAFPAGFVDERRALRDGEAPVMQEWGFMFVGETDAVYEIRKQPGTQRPHLAIWLPRLASVTPDSKTARSSEFKMFVRELRKTLELSRSLVDIRQLKKASVAIGPVNIYGEFLATGDDQLAVATEAESRAQSSSPSSRGGGGAKCAGRAPGAFYMAAAIQYLLALEAFVNVVSEILRKDEFADAIFNRMTREADFESRLLSMSLFCRGFECAPFAPDMALFKRIRGLRQFRNEVLHGSLSHDDHVIRMVPEDLYSFYWWPADDERSLGTHEETRSALPLARTLFTKRHANLVRHDVEAAVDAIICAMQPDYRAWATSWRHDSAVPAYLSDQGWRPILGPEASSAD